MDLSSRGCLLNDPGDGLILSSFQILDQSENESVTDAKETRVLDHFLNVLSYENDNHFKGENTQWKQGNEVLPSSSQAQNESNPFPIDDIGPIEDHDNSMLCDFQAQNINREAPENGTNPENANHMHVENNGDDDDDEEEDGEEGEGRRGSLPCQEQRSDLEKGLPLHSDDACNPIELRDENQEPRETKQQRDYLDMQPVISHPVYIDSATDDMWHQDSTKNEFCSGLKSDEQHQHQQQQDNVCLSVPNWGDSGKGVTKEVDMPPGAVLENHSGSQTQQWNFMHTADEHLEPAHHLLPPPPLHHHHLQPHHHWVAANNINPGGIPAVNLPHQNQQHHGQQHQKQWMSGKNTWVHTHPGEHEDKTMLPSTGQWSSPNTAMAWHKEMGGNFPAHTDERPIHNMFQMTQTQTSDPSVSHTAFPDKGHTIVCNAGISLSPQQAWSLDSHLPTGSNTLYSHQGSHPTMVHCPQPSNTNFFQDPLHLSTVSSSPGCHFQGANIQPMACNMPSDSKKTRSTFNRRRVVSLSDTTVPRCKSAMDQHRPTSHPYLTKDSKVHREGYSNCGSNKCNLTSRLVSWYIDYLIHENENLTQISRAFSLPVNLFHSDDFYFMDSVKKKAHFPSLKFLSWMQQKMPNININSIDFLEGRTPVISMWNQDWFWQNKSRRDIIHDVFFYFQHRRVAYPN